MHTISSNTPNTNLVHNSHAPESFQSNHDEIVDIWSVRYLIKTAFVNVQELSDYARTKLIAEDDLNRPTAKEVLKVVSDNYRGILKEEFLEEDT
ncbi:7644_t:CDS:1, partial [Dentiscutata heterogama]